jgi:intracellular multiplication protein IcmO
MIPREIVGPQERFERTGAQSLRDIRPLTTRLWDGLMSEASGLILAGAAGVMVLERAAIDLVVPASIAYAALVVTRRVINPLRLPASAKMKDWNHPDPKNRRPRMSAGSIYLGRDLKGKELWLSPEDGRQHATIPGTTGAGKTTAILSFLVNALTHTSGFVLVDGKGDQKLYGEVLALARRFGREDDVLHLNLLVASGSKDSHTFNPFAAGNADEIREMVVSQLGDQGGNDSNGIFRIRAVALMGAIVPVLTWIRDYKGIPIDIEKIRCALDLRVIWMLANDRIYELRDPETGKVDSVSVDNMPEDIIYPLKAYLAELSGYDEALPYNKQKSEEPARQHGFARGYFTGPFTQIGGSLGHVFKVEHGDIDMRDVVLNRRILVVSLPALENSSDTLAGLGKIVVSSLRGMMAQMLQISAEMLGPAAPFHVVLDEIAYYASGDLDRMLAQGRSLNIMFWLAFQEVSGIWARLGEKTQTLLGNANLTVAMRQQDAKRTREWIEETAGQTSVTQATSYHGGGGNEYSEARQADVRQVSKVDWSDLQRLIEGEAIILFGGRRIYAKLFHAAIDTSGPVRLTMPLALAAPDPGEIKSECARMRIVRSTIENGLVAAGPPEPRSRTLIGMRKGYTAVAAVGGNAEACVAGAIEAAGQTPSVARANADPNSLNTAFTPMLERAGGEKHGAGKVSAPIGDVDGNLFAACGGIEESSGATPSDARVNALALFAAREAGLASADASRPELAPAAEVDNALQTLMRLREASAVIENSRPAVKMSAGMSL